MAQDTAVARGPLSQEGRWSTWAKAFAGRPQQRHWLDQTGPNWTWTELDQTGPNWTWTKLDQTGPGPTWTKLDQTGSTPNWTKLDQTGPRPNWTKLDQSGANWTWTKLDQTGPNWIWTKLDQTPPVPREFPTRCALAGGLGQRRWLATLGKGAGWHTSAKASGGRPGQRRWPNLPKSLKRIGTSLKAR